MRQLMCFIKRHSSTTRCYLHAPSCDDVGDVGRCMLLLPSGPCRHVADLESSTWGMQCVLLPPGTDLPLHKTFQFYTKLVQPIIVLKAKPTCLWCPPRLRSWPFTLCHVHSVLSTGFRHPSPTVVSAEPFWHGTGTLRCLQKEMVTYRQVSLWRDPDGLTQSNPVPWQNWMAAYLSYTLRMKTLFCGWPVMAHKTHTRRKSTLISSLSLNPTFMHDDAQRFLSYHPSNFHSNISNLQNALQQISSSMTANLLTLNSSKTEFILIRLKQQL